MRSAPSSGMSATLELRPRMKPAEATMMRAVRQALEQQDIKVQPSVKWRLATARQQALPRSGHSCGALLFIR